MAQDITQFRKDVLQFITTFRAKYKYSPSLREIAKGLGYEPETMISSVKNAIEVLVQEEYLTSVGFIARSYIPTKKEMK